MAETARPPLVAPRQLQTIEAVRAVAAGGAFDPDVWHVMDERDNALIADEILHGPGSSKFVYQFDIAGQRDPVSGISVIGARHLAAHYKGLKHRLVAAMQKTGSLFVFTSYPSADQPMAVTASSVPELADEEDFYSAVVEMTDIKTGNSIQMERREPRYGERQGGGHFERPHYATIAQSKAYRNAVLALIPQDIAIRWKMDMLRLRKEDVITESVLDQKRTNVLQFAAARAIALDRLAIEHLTLDQIAGLGDAAREGRLPAFVEAAKALGLEVTQGAAQPEPATAQGAREAMQGRRGQRTPAGRDAAPTASQGGEAARGGPEPTPPGEAVAQQTTSQQTTSQPAKPEPTNEPPKSDAPSQPAGEAAPPGAQPAQETGRRLPRRVNFEA